MLYTGLFYITEEEYQCRGNQCFQTFIILLQGRSKWSNVFRFKRSCFLPSGKVLTDEQRQAHSQTVFCSAAAAFQESWHSRALYWTLQFSPPLDSRLASGLGAWRPRLALRPSLGLPAGLLSGRLLMERDLAVGSRKGAPESTGLCWEILTCNTSIVFRGLKSHLHFYSMKNKVLI